MNRTTQYLQSASAEPELEISQLVNCVLADAVSVGASDVHLEPWESSIAVRVRLNGVLTELIHLPRPLMEKIAARFKVMASLVSYQTDLPQDGHVPADPALGGAELRISIFPTSRGEKVVVRIFDPSQRSFELETLGFDPEILAEFTELLARPGGLILLTGPTGSGKTTTIYGALSHIVQRSGPALSISTIEDPVEFDLPMISQGQVNPLREFTYPVAMRALLRQDPQVIMVGEIRDPETAAIALQAGLTGHTVISTIHSASSAGVFARLIHMDIEPFLLASSVVGVVGVRLLRRNCPACAQPYRPDAPMLRWVPSDLLETARFCRGTGCPACLHTGYAGRSALGELLKMTEPLREAVLQKLPTRTLQEVAKGQGMKTLWQLGLRRALRGQTPLEEVLRVVAAEQVEGL